MKIRKLEFYREYFSINSWDPSEKNEYDVKISGFAEWFPHERMKAGDVIKTSDKNGKPLFLEIKEIKYESTGNSYYEAIINVIDHPD